MGYTDCHCPYTDCVHDQNYERQKAHETLARLNTQRTARAKSEPKPSAKAERIAELEAELRRLRGK